MPEEKVEGPTSPWGLRNSHDIWPFKGHDDDDDDLYAWWKWDIILWVVGAPFLEMMYEICEAHHLPQS